MLRCANSVLKLHRYTAEINPVIAMDQLKSPMSRNASLFGHDLPEIVGFSPDRRRDDRHVVIEHAIGWLSFDVRRHLYGRVIDLSDGGMCIYSLGRLARDFVQLGDMTSFVIQFNQQRVHGVAQLRNLIQDEESIRMGLAFVGMSPLQRAELESLIDQMPKYADIEVIEVGAIDTPLPLH